MPHQFHGVFLPMLVDGDFSNKLGLCLGQRQTRDVPLEPDYLGQQPPMMRP